MQSLTEYSGADDPLAICGGWLIPTPAMYTVQFHWKIAGSLFTPSRYKVLEGGRGGMKSWGVARALLIRALQQPLRILCAREFMTSIEDSVYKLLKDQIVAMGLSPWYHIAKTGIYAPNGSEFLFVGLADMTQRLRRTKIKSFEGIDICWIEEAETITDESWQLLIPTIRKKGSEIWVVYNPNLASDATYKRFHDNPPPGTLNVTLNWRDNVWLSRELSNEKDHLFAVDPEAAAHVWDGELRKHAEAAILRGKYTIHNFETPAGARFFHGVDWGFANDPTVMVRMFITGKPPYEELWIDDEAWGIGVEINELARNPADPAAKLGLFDKIETSRQWPIKADGARPEHISYLRKNCGLNIVGAEKWDGSVEDGIKHLRGFVTIHIHKDRCPHTADEFRLYSYKVDRMTGEILPIIVDKHNHCIAAGELITTERGLIPIEQVRVGDSVLTRNGFSKVINAWKASDNAALWRLKAGGKTLYGTPEHKVYTANRGFIRMDALRYTDSVLVEESCGSVRLPSGMDVATTAINSRTEALTIFDAPGGMARNPRPRYFIEKCGKLLIDLFPPDSTSIIKTSTEVITRLITSNASSEKIIKKSSIQSAQNRIKGNVITFRRSDHSLRFGMLVRKGGLNIGRLELLPIATLTQSLNPADSAESRFSLKRWVTGISFVQTLASLHGDESLESMTLIEPVTAESPSGVTAIARSRLVPVSVDSVCATNRRSAVYDLTVADQHEFVASGILVSNCVDAVRYGLDQFIMRRGVSALWARLAV